LSILGDILFLYSSKDRYDTALSYKTYVFLFKVHSSFYLNLWSLFCWASFRSALDKQELVKYKYDKPMINVQIWVPRKLVRVWYHFKWFLKLQSETLFHFEDFESSKFLSLIGEDTIISKIGPLSLAQSNDSKSSMWKSVWAIQLQVTTREFKYSIYPGVRPTLRHFQQQWPQFILWERHLVSTKLKPPLRRERIKKI